MHDTVPAPEERQADIRQMIAQRGWTTQVQSRAMLRVALAMVAEGVQPFKLEEARRDFATA